MTKTQRILKDTKNKEHADRKAARRSSQGKPGRGHARKQHRYGLLPKAQRQASIN